MIHCPIASCVCWLFGLNDGWFYFLMIFGFMIF